jgi:hypothetical protein
MISRPRGEEMTGRAVPTTFLASAMVAVIVVALCGCARKPAGPRIVLGPKPTPVVTPTRVELNQLQDPMMNACRGWLESLSEADAKTLEEQGKLAFGIDELRKKDPEHAKLVEDYLGKSHALAAQRAAARGRTYPQLTLQEVSFVKHAPGAFEMVFTFAEGGFSNLPLSEPLPAK